MTEIHDSSRLQRTTLPRTRTAEDFQASISQFKRVCLVTPHPRFRQHKLAIRQESNGSTLPISCIQQPPAVIDTQHGSASAASNGGLRSISHGEKRVSATQTTPCEGHRIQPILPQLPGLSLRSDTLGGTAEGVCSADGEKDSDNWSTVAVYDWDLRWKFDHFIIDGRTYNARLRDSYLLPDDALGAERLDLLHHLSTLLHGDKLYLAPLDSPCRILDVGSGTGMWAIDSTSFPTLSASASFGLSV